ncbi:hypothetical protein K2Z84_05000 [Candidatus Binatia bacterium]|jgi:hypothetical protein|nr:hypothetical protein [Candidatus Binatia bacterium]
MRSIDDRVAVLERRLSGQRRLTGALVACLIGLLTMGAGGSDLVQARRIEVVDGSGKALLVLEARDGRGVLELQSEMGQRAGMLTTTPDGGAFGIYDERGHEVVTLGAAGDGGLVETTTAGGKTLVQLGAGAAGGGALSTFAATGKRLVEIGATADGEGTVATFDARGAPLLALAAGDHGSARIVAYQGVKQQAVWPPQ